MSKYIPTEEEDQDIKECLDPYYFEGFCGSCMYFGTDKCPNKGKVETQTNSKSCFYDWYKR